MAEYIEREAVKALFDERYETAFVQERTRENKEYWRGVCTGLNWGRNTIADATTADVVPKSEVVWDIFDKVDEIAYRYLNNADYSAGDMIYDLNELKKKYTEGNQNANGN